MSQQGLNKVAAIFQQMQLLRIELLREPHDHQDLFMGQMLDEGKDAMQPKFLKATTMKPRKSGGAAE